MAIKKSRSKEMKENVFFGFSIGVGLILSFLAGKMVFSIMEAIIKFCNMSFR
jgi:hypothetical protein